MRILIIEDELPASNELIAVLKQVEPLISVEAVLQTVHDVRERLSLFEGKVDLIFMDIQLQGISILSALPELSLPAPAIFVTAYDEFLVDALQHTSLDYILKPVDKEKIQKALYKYAEIRKHFFSGYEFLLQQLAHKQKKRRSRILLRKGPEFHFCRIEDVAYFYSEFKLVFLVDFKGQKHLTDLKTLNALEEELDPYLFYRANRKFIVNINAIKKFRSHDRVKLLVELVLKAPEDIIISQDSAAAFKNWISSKNDQEFEVS